SRFLRYVDTRPNGEALRKCILSGPYKPTTILVQAVEATDNSPVVPEHTTVETPTNMSPENKAHFLAKKEAIHLIQTGIRDDIYSTVDACQIAHEMWEAIERFVTIVKQQHKLDEVSYHKLFDILKQYQNEVNELRAEKLARNANPLAVVATAQADRDPYYQTLSSYRSSVPSPKPSIPSRSHTSTRHKGKEIAKPITPLFETASEEDNDPEQAQKDKDMQKNLALIAKYFKKIYKPTNNNLRTSSNSKNKNVDTTSRYKNDDHSGQFGTQRIVNVVGTREKVGSPVVQKSGIQCFNCKEYGHFTKEYRKPKRVKDFAYHKEKMMLCKQAEQDSDTDHEPVEQVQNDAGYNVFANGLQHSDQFESTKQTEFEKYKAFNDRTVDYDKLEHKLHEALGQLAHKDTVIREGLVKQKTKVITDLKLREEHDIEKMLSMEKQLKFLNEVVYKRSQSIQTIHMMAPKVSTYNGRPTFANPRYLKPAQSEIPCLYAFPYDQNTHANRLIFDGEETLALERDSQSKLNKDSTRPYDYTKLNSLYEIFKPPTQDKSRQAYNVMTNNINHFKQIVDNAWIKHSKDQFRVPTAQDMEILIQTCLIPLAIKTENDSFKFVHELKQEMHADLKYVESIEKEIDELKSDKAEFSNMYNEILQECVSKDVMCSYFLSLSDLDALDGLQCMYPRKVKECVCLAQKLSKQTESISKKVHTELLQRFAKVEKHSISLELALQKCKEQIVQLILFIVDSGCMKHMTGNLKLLCNFVEKFLGTVRLNHNLFPVGQFCDVDLKVAFRKSTCFVRDLQGNDLLTGNRGSDLYRIYHQESTSSTPLCLMAKATPTQAWLWHRRLSHLNFDYINLLSKKDIMIGLPKLKYVKDQLCSSCELSKAKRSSFKDGENLDKIKENGDQCILVGYSTQSKGYCVYNKRTRMIVESIHIRFDEIKEVSETSVANNTSGLVPQRQKASDYDNPELVPQRQDVSSSADADVLTQQELDLLFGPLYDEFFNAGSNPSTNFPSTTAPSTQTNMHAEENNNDQEEEG
nr:hypothetical protein [Tanacetum cinerariifolium]